MPMRSFSLNEHRSHAGDRRAQPVWGTGAHDDGEKRNPEAYEALGGRSEEAWIPNGALPRAPRWPRGDSSVSVRAETDMEAEEAFRAWLRHVEAGRIGSEG